jgi:hypothetical protein
MLRDLPSDFDYILGLQESVVVGMALITPKARTKLQ